MKKLLIGLAFILTVTVAYKAFAQVSASSDCSSASITEFGNIQINGSQPFYQSLLSQAQSDLQQKEQTDAAIQAGEADDEVKIATANAGLNAISNCLLNQESNAQVNSAT